MTSFFIVILCLKAAASMFSMLCTSFFLNTSAEKCSLSPGTERDPACEETC